MCIGLSGGWGMSDLREMFIPVSLLLEIAVPDERSHSLSS